ncbi:MAG: phospholipase D-like domain-containing protein [Bdellovibrionia bacterium]
MVIVQHLLSVISFLLGMLLISQLLRERKAPGSTVAWLLLMILIPYVGAPLYLTFGGRKIKKRASKKQRLYPSLPFWKASLEILPIERILLSSGVPSIKSDNHVELLSTGEQAYSELKKLIQGAKKSIHITTFILGKDKVGEDILSQLQIQAQRGVEVCLLLDGFGSLWVTNRSLRLLRAAGGQVAFFLPIFRIPLFGRSHLRNHRKAVIVDGKSAIIGGMNLAEEYLGPTPSPKRWVDLSLLVKGSAAGDLEDIFCSDWAFASEHSLAKVLSAKGSEIPVTSGTAKIQVVASGPDVSGDPLYDSILSAVFGAQKRVWIATPYFIPDETLSKALELAARRGVDVRLLVPKRSDHFLADLCRGSYLRQLDRAGGQIFYFVPRMMHAKVAIIDESYAIVGSANIDMRSLLLNYEIGAYLYSSETIQMISEWFSFLQKDTVSRRLRKYRGAELLDGLGRILGPML